MAMTGTDQVLKNLRKAVKRVSAGAAEGIDQGAEVLLEESLKLVPVDSGALRDSGKVVDGAVVYDAPHAVTVHEDLDAQHANGQAKFLEAAARDRQVRRRMLEAVAKPLKL